MRGGGVWRPWANLAGMQLLRGGVSAMKTHDYEYCYTGGPGGPACCRLRVYRVPVAGRVVAVATDLGRGMSLAALAERVAGQIERRHCCDPGWGFVWVEHHPSEDVLPGGGWYAEESYDVVTFRRWDDGQLGAPRRERAARGVVETLIGEPLED